jgi:uncharacterized RDD family membrane protein YckC
MRNCLMGLNAVGFVASVSKGLGNSVVNTILRQQLLSLGIMLVVSLPIWRHYRQKKVALELKYSTFGPRFWTGFVDSCVLWPIGVISGVYLIVKIPTGLAAALVIVGNLSWLFYTVLLHARYGQTIGKMVTKVRVVDFRTESKISIRQAWLREGIPLLLSVGGVIYEISLILNGRLTSTTIASDQLFNDRWYWLANSVPLLWFAAEVLTMLTNRKRRALHDFIAGTVVVRTNIDYGNANSGKASQPGSGMGAPAPAA